MFKSCLTLICGLFVFSSFAQKPVTLSGTITDQKSGETLISASIVLLENKGAGTLSNSYGFYSITAPAAEYTLVVSFSGYFTETRHIKIDKDLHLSIALKTGADSLQEVIV